MHFVQIFGTWWEAGIQTHCCYCSSYYYYFSHRKCCFTCWKDYSFLNVFSWNCFWRPIEDGCMSLFPKHVAFLWSICLCGSTTLCQLQQRCSTFWNRKLLVLQLCSSFLRLFWISCVSCIFTSFRNTCQFIGRSQLLLWHWFHEIHRSIWWRLPSQHFKFSYTWTSDIFSFT